MLPFPKPVPEDIKIDYGLIRGLLSAVLLIAGFFLFQKSLLNLNYLNAIFLLFLSILTALIFSHLNIADAVIFASGSLYGSLLSYSAGIGYGFLTLLASSVASNFLFKRRKALIPSEIEVSNYIVSFFLAYCASYPFTVLKMPPFFVILFGFLFVALYLFLSQRCRKLSFKQVNADRIKFSSLILPIIMFSSLLYYYGSFALPVLFLLASLAFKNSMRRFLFFDATQFLANQAEYISGEVFGTKEILSSAEALSRAIESSTNGSVSAQKLYNVFLFGGLLWINFGKPLYRRPELLNQMEYEVLRSNLDTLKELLMVAGLDAEVVESVYRLYENYDGTGIPEGIEAEEIPLLSRFARILEKYLILTSWSESSEPLADRQAVEEIEKYSGVFFDPDAVRVLSGIVLPDFKEETDESKESEEEEEGDKSDENKSVKTEGNDASE